ncbi:MAG: glycosyltransferase [Chloroflexi bacterium]|nr:glycosyltransferase [Chloroflexota bacterium]
MKLLFVTVEPPWPPQGGSSLRTYNFIRLLSARHEVHLACYASVRQEVALRQGLTPLCRGIHAVSPPPGRTTWQRALEVATSPFPDLAHRFGGEALGTLVEGLLSRQRFDVVHLVGLEAAGALFPLKEDGASVVRGRAKVVLDELNAEYRLQERAFRAGLASPGQWSGALYSWVQGWKLRHYEADLCGSVDGVVTVSSADREALRRLTPQITSSVVPNGVDTKRYHPPDSAFRTGDTTASLPEGGAQLLFTGTMDFRPNVDAMVWFVEEVLPLVAEAVPEVRLSIVGRNPAPRVLDLAGELVEVTGEVPEDLPYFHRAQVFVLPVRFGGGSRLKLLQALACGLPVVTTVPGAEGVDLRPGEHALVANTAWGFARAVVRLLRARPLAARLAASGRALAERYDWEGMAPLLEAFYRLVCGSHVLA